MPNEVSQFINKLGFLKTDRSNFDNIWDDVQQLVWPDGYQFLSRDSPGEKKTQHVFEMTAANSLEKFASAMESFLTPRFMRWHTLRATDEALMRDKQVQVFFEQTTDILFKMRNSPVARFPGQMHENLKSLGAYGNGCIFVDEPPSGRGTRYRHIPVGKVWIDVDYQNEVDTVFYEYKLTAKAAAQKWPHAVPERADKALKSGKDFQENTYLHVVQPNPDRDPDRMDARGARFVGIDIDVDGQSIIPNENGEPESAFFEMPYIYSRFTVNPAEKHGRGPAMLVLPNIQTLQEMMKTFLRSGHKVADPPLLVSDDGRLGRGNRKVRIAAGALNFGGLDESGRPRIVPLQTGARLDLTDAMLDREIAAIESAFFIDLFDLLLRDRVEMTATEVLERAKEKGQLVTPVVGRQQNELLGPMIVRELGILQRQGSLPPLPPVLVEAQGEFEIEYESTATRLQSANEVAAYQRLLEVFGPQAQLDPGIMDVLNTEDAMRVFGQLMGVRPSLLKTEREMQQVRAAQAQQAQQQQALEAAPGVGAAVRDISEANLG